MFELLVCKRFLFIIVEQKFYDVIMVMFCCFMEWCIVVDVSDVGIIFSVEQVFDGLDFFVMGGVKQYCLFVGVMYVQFICCDVCGVCKCYCFVSFIRMFWGLFLL